MSCEIEEPALQFFRKTPAHFLDRPPTASSLQHFESCLILVAQHRYPHALAACTFAVESAIKAGFGLRPEHRTSLARLLERARERFPSQQALDPETTKELRETRNRIVHYGFSPKDDRLTAGLLLKAAIPLLGCLYEGFFQFELHEGLLVEIADQLRIASEAFQVFSKDQSLDVTRCFLSLGHLIRWNTKYSVMSPSELEAAKRAEEIGVRFEAIMRRKSKLKRLLDPSWVFDCPICCGIETLVAEIDRSRLYDPHVSLLRAVCLECGLVIPENTPFLADAICREQVKAKKDDILRDFGLK